MREQRKVGLVPEDVTAHRLLIVAHLDVQMGGHVHQVPRTGSVSTTDDFGRTPIEGAHLQSAGGSVSGVSPCGSQCPIRRRSPAISRGSAGVSQRGQSMWQSMSHSKALTGPISFRWILRWQSQTCSRHAPRPRSMASFARSPIGLSFLSAEYLADRCTERSSGVIRGHQRSSEVIRGHQRPSARREALRAEEDR